MQEGCKKVEVQEGCMRVEVGVQGCYTYLAHYN